MHAHVSTLPQRYCNANEKVHQQHKLGTASDGINTIQEKETRKLVEGVISMPSSLKNPCVICADGVTFDGVFEDKEGVDGTCHSAISEIASAFELGSGECYIGLELLEPLCCPTPSTCVLCPNGITLDGKVKVEGETFTCSDLVVKAAQQE